MTKIIELKRKLVLASQSPRRQHLLELLGLKFDIIPANIDEDIDYQLKPNEIAEKLAVDKAQSVARNYTKRAFILGGDTIVVYKDQILNKPKSAADACSMLKLLSGKTHIVYTGFAFVICPEMELVSSCVATEVSFRDLDENEIDGYVESGSPLDKAGAYGIQDDFGAVFVRHIKGCYYNIVGLPLEAVYSTLKLINK
ncbi:MAG: Maf family protein [Candidatus Kapabacteria bacterium]|nr:Maf family protein [Candidatus Kapabacteria bacterium]